MEVSSRLGGGASEGVDRAELHPAIHMRRSLTQSRISFRQVFVRLYCAAPPPKKKNNEETGLAISHEFFFFIKIFL